MPQYQIDVRKPETLRKLRNVKEGEPLEVEYGPKGAGTEFRKIGSLSLTVQQTRNDTKVGSVRRLVCVDSTNRRIEISVYSRYHSANVDIPD